MEKDWKDALNALRGSLNSAPPDDEKIEPEETKNKFQKQPLHIITDKKGRNGKIATIIEGFTIDRDEVENIARQLKQKLGVGGSVRDREILIQGDHKETIKKFLNSLHFNTKG